MLLTIYSTADLEIVVAQNLVAVEASEAIQMELLLPLLGFQVWAFYAAIAFRAQRIVKLVIMLLTVRVVVDHVKVSSCER